MWFFMITCYVLTAVTFLMLLTALLQGWLGFLVFQANQVTFTILTSIVYLFTETLVIFFFVGTGVSVKEYTAKHQMKPDFYQAAIRIKRRIYPPLLLNMLFMITLFVLVGAVDTGHLGAGIYRAYFVFCLGHYLYAKRIAHVSFRENTFNILAMVGMPRNT